MGKRKKTKKDRDEVQGPRDSRNTPQTPGDVRQHESLGHVATFADKTESERENLKRNRSRSPQSSRKKPSSSSSSSFTRYSADGHQTHSSWSEQQNNREHSRSRHKADHNERRERSMKSNPKFPRDSTVIISEDEVVNLVSDSDSEEHRSRSSSRTEKTSKRSSGKEQRHCDFEQNLSATSQRLPHWSGERSRKSPKHEHDNDRDRRERSHRNGGHSASKRRDRDASETRKGRSPIHDR